MNKTPIAVVLTDSLLAEKVRRLFNIMTGGCVFNDFSRTSGMYQVVAEVLPEDRVRLIELIRLIIGDGGLIFCK